MSQFGPGYWIGLGLAVSLFCALSFAVVNWVVKWLSSALKEPHTRHLWPIVCASYFLIAGFSAVFGGIRFTVSSPLGPQVESLLFLASVHFVVYWLRVSRRNRNQDDKVDAPILR